MEGFFGEKASKHLAYELKHQSYSLTQRGFILNKSYEYAEKIPIGVDEFGDILYIDFSKSKKILILGKTGSGKSWLTRSILTRYYKGVGSVVILTDIKPEYYTISQPLQAKFRKFLLKNEVPVSIPCQNFYPYFFTKFVKREFPDNELIQLSLQDLNYFDFLTITETIELSDLQKTFIQSLFELVREGKIRNFDDMKEAIANSKDINMSTKQVLLNKISIIEKLEVIGDAYSEFSFTDCILEKKVPILNLCGYNKLGGNASIPSAFLAVILRKIMADKVEGIIPKDEKLLFVIDEASKFCPATGMSASKKEILDVLDLSRSEKVSMIFSTQDWKRIPETVLKQCAYVFVPYSMDFEDFRYIVEKLFPQDYDYPVSFKVSMAQEFGSMKMHKDGSRDWMLLDTEKKRRIIFVPAAPLSYHLEE